MAKKASKSTEKKVPAIKDLPTNAKQASEVKGGKTSASLLEATTTGSHYPKVIITA